MALKQLSLIVDRQAVVMAFADAFLILSVLFVALAAPAIVMKRPAAEPGGASALSEYSGFEKTPSFSSAKLLSCAIASLPCS